jgi:hypothetical protein
MEIRAGECFLAKSWMMVRENALSLFLLTLFRRIFHALVLARFSVGIAEDFSGHSFKRNSSAETFIEALALHGLVH